MQCLCKNQGCARVINLVINFLRAVYTPISEIKTVCVIYLVITLLRRYCNAYELRVRAFY